jgi:Holliday junction resolvase RusA-like endonuclease
VTLKDLHIVTLKLNGAVVPKARPRVTKNGTFMPKNYTEWKASAITDFIIQMRDHNLTYPLDKIMVKIALIGKHPKRGDLDNIAGAILDALVQSEFIKNDGLNNVSNLAVGLQLSKEDPIVMINIYSNRSCKKS